MGDEGVSVEEGVGVSDNFGVDVGEEHCGNGDDAIAFGEDGFESIISRARDLDFEVAEGWVKLFSLEWVMKMWILHLSKVGGRVS